MNEIWKPVEDYKGLYEISNLGNARSLPRIVRASCNSRRLIRPRILKPFITKNGYVAIKFTKNKCSKMAYIHRLVAKAFIANPNGYSQINHKDENKSNNCVDNLEWCTHLYNMNYGTARKRITAKQINHPKISKPVLQIDKNGVIVAEFPSASEATRVIGTKRSNSSSILGVCRGENKTAFGFYWKFK